MGSKCCTMCVAPVMANSGSASGVVSGDCQPSKVFGGGSWHPSRSCGTKVAAPDVGSQILGRLGLHSSGAMGVRCCDGGSCSGVVTCRGVAWDASDWGLSVGLGRLSATHVS